MGSFLDDNELYLKSFITMMGNSNSPWGIKDLSSRHIYMNKEAYLYTNTPFSFNIVEKLDEEFPAEWTEFCTDLQEHDRKTEAMQDRVAVIETHYWYGKDSLTPFVSEKLPVYNNKNALIGIMWNARPLNTLSPLVYINQKKPSILTTKASHLEFTQAELDTIFLILQRYTSKEIARIYNVAHKTIENRIYNIYQKADVHTLQQFEEYCKQANLDSYIPARLIDKGVQFI